MERRLLAELARQQHQSEEDRRWLQMQEDNLVSGIHEIHKSKSKNVYFLSRNQNIVEKIKKSINQLQIAIKISFSQSEY